MRSIHQAVLGVLLVLGATLACQAVDTPEDTSDKKSSSKKKKKTKKSKKKEEPGEDPAPGPKPPTPTPNPTPGSGELPSSGFTVTVTNNLGESVNRVALRHKGGTVNVGMVPSKASVVKSVPGFPETVSYAIAAGEPTSQTRSEAANGKRGVVTVLIDPEGKISWTIVSME
jgi:hypothetical protein